MCFELLQAWIQWSSASRKNSAVGAPVGNVQATSDFRGVYASLLEQWLGVDAAAVIPEAGTFQRPLLVR